jgi:hypothetical protein
MNDFTESEIECAKQYLICQERGHVASSMRTASNPPQDICQQCGTYYWTVVTRTLYEGMGKPKPEAIEAARQMNK